MDSFIDFVSRLVYENGAGAPINPNHRTFAGGAPTGVQWLAHHVGVMLPAYEGWLATHNQPPILAWDGTSIKPWPGATGSTTLALGTGLDGSFTGITTEEQLGAALRNRLTSLGSVSGAREFGNAVQMPFSHRYWGYVKWASILRRRFEGQVVVPPAVMYDRDGTIRSAIPFLDVMNELHWRFHDYIGTHGFPAAMFPETTPVGTQVTPGLESTAGQRAAAIAAGSSGDPIGEEFFRFHRDHIRIYNEWQGRNGLPPVEPLNMTNGWPTSPATNPATWTEPNVEPWVNPGSGDPDNSLLASGGATLGIMGLDIGPIHGAGHNNNGDIGHPFGNNYVPRFYAWHDWVDFQWFWRAPRFALWNAATRQREKVFGPVLSTGAAWPGLPAITIVREPGTPADVLSPTSALAAHDLTSGAGTLAMEFRVSDSYNRQIQLTLTGEAFDDTAATPLVETVTLPAFQVGGSAGAVEALDTVFTRSFAFTQAFRSDDPTRANPAVGFVNNRVRITGTLVVADGSEPGFTLTEFVDIHLVREKQEPQVEVYLDLASFSEEQVTARLAASGGTEARFQNALIVTVQDRTAAAAPITWPATVVDEVKGLVTGRTPACGLFDAVAHRPSAEIWQAAGVADAPFTGLAVQAASGPVKEDPSLADNLPQRFTYRYDVVFTPGNDAFTGLAAGMQRIGRLRVGAYDRSGNAATDVKPIKLFRDPNPYMVDGDPSWLSVDTCVFRVNEGESLLGATLAAGQPNPFIQQVLQNFNDGTTPAGQFDTVRNDPVRTALEYATQVPNHINGTVATVHNFALARVKLQGTAGASAVRAFFRLFRYTASNLIFDPSTGYRTHDDSAGKKVPLLGFASPAAGAALTSIPFFAEPRRSYADPATMTAQTDLPNVQAFIADSTATGERILYFGAYLDINQSSALPNNRIAVHPDGPFTPAEVHPIRTLMMDAHQCMVVEINFDGDATGTGATPADSDNLAQRNLVILTTDNPGALLTHTVQHSFEAETVECCRREGLITTHALAGLVRGGVHGHHVTTSPTAHGHGQEETEATGHEPHGHSGHEHGHDHDHVATGEPFGAPALRFVSSSQRERLVAQEAAFAAWRTPEGHVHGDEVDVDAFLEGARETVQQRFPWAFDGAEWQRTTETIDELAIFWNDLPDGCTAEVYLPRINCEHVMNLRSLRHAPDDVKIVDSHTLRLDARGVTYLPLPPTEEGRVAGIITVELPDGIRTGQNWKVDVVQLRGGEGRTTGGFQLDIRVSKAERIFEDERRLLGLMAERLAATPRQDRWHPVLLRRVETIRGRARALAESAGVPWSDPTRWAPANDPTRTQPIQGTRIRVVLEKLRLENDSEPWWKGRGEVLLEARVRSEDNGGTERRTVLPAAGIYRVGDRPGQNELVIEQEVFAGVVAGSLGIEIAGVEVDTFDPDDDLGRYARRFDCTCEEMLGRYGPADEGSIDPERVGRWSVWYRIERA